MTVPDPDRRPPGPRPAVTGGGQQAASPPERRASPAEPAASSAEPASPAEPAASPAEHALPAELAAALAQIVPPGGGFGHREHVHLAFIAVRRYGPERAAAVVAGWIRHLAAYHRAPQKFNATVTRAWVEIVAYHLATGPAGADFAAFAGQHPDLLDKRLLSRHYTSRALASAAARRGWLEPDLAAFPWRP